MKNDKLVEATITLLTEGLSRTKGIKKETKRLKKESIVIDNIVWENMSEYDETEIDEIKDILDNLDPEAIKHNNHSVAVRDNYSELVFWLDFTQEGPDIVGDWNQYIFNSNDSIDRKRQAIQTSYYEDSGTTIAFEAMDSVAMDYLAQNNIVDFNKKGMYFTDGKTESKIVENENDEYQYLNYGISGIDGIPPFNDIDLAKIDGIEKLALQTITKAVKESNVEGKISDDILVDTAIGDVGFELIDLIQNGLKDQKLIDKYFSNEDDYTNQSVFMEMFITYCRWLAGQNGFEVVDELVENSKEKITEADATSEFIEDFKNLLNKYCRVKIENMTYDKEKEIVNIDGKEISIVGDSNLAAIKDIANMLL